MELTQIGKTGRPHGVKGEIKIFVADHYEDDLFNAKAVLIGNPAMPYFIQSLRAGGSIIGKFEDLDSREFAVLLSNQPLYLRTEEVKGEVPPDDHPFAFLIGYDIEAEGYERFGPIEDVLDLPEHYLAQLTRGGQEVYVPLHEDLVVEVKQAEKVIVMKLVEGLFD